MTKEKTPFNLRNVVRGGIITGLLSSTCSFLYNIALRQIFTDRGDLVYEAATITQYQENQQKYSVCNIPVTNIGNGLIEDVTFSVSLKGKDENLKCSYRQSSYHIRVHIQSAPTAVDVMENNIYALPYINPTENIVFEFKVNGNIVPQNLKIELRGKGYIGRLKGQEDTIERLKRFYLSLLSLFLAIIFLLILLRYKKKRVINDSNTGCAPVGAIIPPLVGFSFPKDD